MRGAAWVRGMGLGAGMLALVACATAQPADAPVVSDLDIRGNQAVSDRTLKRKILTSETGWWPFAQTNRFDPVEWHTDLRRIERYYETQGYFGARVLESRVISLAPNRVALVIEVNEDLPVRIAHLDVEGLSTLSTLEPETRARLVEELSLVPGAIFREDDWTAAKHRLRSRLRDGGHAEAEVTGRALVDVGTHSATLTLLATPGPRYRFGDIQVRATPGAVVDPAWVREQVQMALGQDRFYSDEDLAEAQRRIFGMGVFSIARVTMGDLDREAKRVPVLVDVREAPMHTIRFGGGLGFDQVRQEGRLVAQWTDRNFRGGLRRLSARALGGWAFIPSTLAVARGRQEEFPRHGPIYKAGLEFEQPRLFARPTLALRTLIESERTLEQTFDAIGGRGMAGVIWQPTSTFTIFPGYHLQAYRLRGPRTATAETAPLALGCAQDPCFVLLSYLEQVVTWDRRDDPLDARRGSYLSVSLQEGGGPLQGDFTYVRLLPEARAYFSPGDDDRLTFALKVRLGTLLTLPRDPDASAVVTRFYSGGNMGMRGFGIRRLSPLLLVPTAGADDPEARIALPIGGNGLVEGNVEGRRRISQRLAIASFVDFGTVTRQALPVQDLSRLLWAIGLGIRFATPIGPLRADFAFRLPVGRPPPLFDIDGQEITYRRLPGGAVEPGRETGANVNQSCFGLGGRERATWVRDSLCAFHVSIGEAF
jgi:translocation and assembly module TamA